MTPSPTKLTKAQLEMLQLMEHPMTEEDLDAIKKLIATYFAGKLTSLVDKVWGEGEWDEQKILDMHMRTPYTKTR